MPEKKDATKLIENAQNKNNLKHKTALKGISQDLLNKVIAISIIVAMPFISINKINLGLSRLPFGQAGAILCSSLM